MNDTPAQPLRIAGQTVTVHMPSSRNGRRFALVSRLLSEMKIHHTAVFPLFRRLRLKGLEAAVIQSPYCTVTLRKPKHSDILISDQLAQNDGGKTVQVSYEFMNHLKGDPQPETLFLPIMFHPSLLTEINYSLAGQFAQNTDRSIGILFAGNCDPKTYDNERIGNQYGLANRHELFEHVRTLSTDLVFIPTNKAAFEEALESGAVRNKFVWIDTEAFRIPQSEWFELLAKARYFFCTPGVHYPYCQNLNEAAACGTVPILQYPDFYMPRLRHGEDCLTFKDLCELENLFSTVLKSPDQAKWINQSKSVTRWQHLHMSLDHAQSQLFQFLNDPNRKHLTWVLAGK